MREYRTVAVAAAQQAGKIISDAYRTDFQVYYKHGATTNLVTDVDRRAEQAIVEILTAAFPGHGILAEECGEVRAQESPYRWIVDPLDGTSNFAHGFPVFCVSIGLEVDGEIALGVVYDPLRQELFEAERNKGAFLNGQRLEVSSVTELSRALVVTGFPYDPEGRRWNAEYFKQFAIRAQGIRRTGSAAIDLCYVASGRVDAFWEPRLYPWDVAAGSLMVTEAGGRLSDFAGRPFSFLLTGFETLASNGRIHQAMIDVLGGPTRC